jgi:hypothetical protein
VEERQNDWVGLWRWIVRLRPWIFLGAAAAVGPVFLKLGDWAGPVFGAAGAAVILVWIVIVPLLVLAGGRFPFLVWQVAVLSIALTTILSGLEDHFLRHNQILSVLFSFWAGGTLFSLPLPSYLFLRRLPVRQRYVFGILILGLAALLWIGVRKAIVLYSAS